jgi:oligopeptide/dipeptide ABC transporter ATP-binding protein
VSLLAVRDLTVTYPSAAGPVRAVRGVSFDLAQGEILGIVGESGCGKSSLGRALLRLTPADGSIRLRDQDWLALQGEPLRRARRAVQIVFQDPAGSLDPRQRVRDILREPLAIHHPVGLEAGDAALREALTAVQLDADLLDRHAHELSGGQCQRIAIARALLVGPDILVCDEAVSALDVTVRSQVVGLLLKLREARNLSIVFIAHDLALVRHLCDRVLVMYAGRIVEAAGAAELFNDPQHPYTRALIAAVPRPDPAAARPLPLEGEPPSPLAPDAGCAFMPRCATRVARCTLDAPALEGPGRQVACHRAGESKQVGGES